MKAQPGNVVVTSLMCDGSAQWVDAQNNIYIAAQCEACEYDFRVSVVFSGMPKSAEESGTRSSCMKILEGYLITLRFFSMHRLYSIIERWYDLPEGIPLRGGSYT